MARAPGSRRRETRPWNAAGRGASPVPLRWRGEPEADAANRVQETRRGGVIPQLPSQPADVHVQGLGRAEPVLVPHARDQVLAGDDLAGVGDELGQQIELL